MNDLIQWLLFTKCQYVQFINTEKDVYQLRIFSDGTITDNQLCDIQKICQRNGLNYGINLTGNYILIY